MRPTASDRPNGTTATTSSDDELRSALDHFAHAVHWLRARTSYSAIDAITEAVTDWIIEHPDPVKTTEATDGLIGLGDVSNSFTATINRLVESGTAITAASAITEAINDWTAAASTEHHHSQPFQPPVRPVDVVA